LPENHLDYPPKNRIFSTLNSSWPLFITNFYFSPPDSSA